LRLTLPGLVLADVPHHRRCWSSKLLQFEHTNRPSPPPIVV
jgi:hypothetical protein